MPLYEYRCQQCGRLTEKIQKFSDPELTVCPFCSGRLERTLTAPAVHFSGGGWYKDLYSSAKPADTKASGGEAAPAAAAESASPASKGEGAAKPSQPIAAPAPASSSSKE